MGTATINQPRSRSGYFFLMLAIFCLTLSLIVHLFFIQTAKKWEMPGFSPESYDAIVPRTFRMKRVEIDPKTLENENPPVKQEQRKPVPVALDKEIPQTDNTVLATEEKSILTKPQESVPLDKPDARTPAPGLESLLNKTDSTSVHSLIGELPKSDANNMALGAEDAVKLPDSEKEGYENGNQAGMPQFSSLDDLLSKSGKVKKNTAPILMPTDLLFEYDSDALKPVAAESLTKLGSLIKKNIEASFRIEGNTDSFGSDEYNMQLSLRRAEAVKNWLGINMGIDAARISTVGLGKSRLLVPATGSVEQQQLNRRVEIVISVPKGSTE